ncbi:MAG: HAD family phosphatase [Chloroflexota bacterium]
MTIRAVFFDLGGVIVRTEKPEPRTRLADNLGMSNSDLYKLVFENDSSRQASLGLISEEQHWLNITRSLGQQESRVEYLYREFFAGDQVDPRLVELIRSLRHDYKLGVISNAWSGMRAWMENNDLADAFDDMVFSAEVGFAKPDPHIYLKALENLNILPAESIFVDDTLKNVEAARIIGMHAIHFTHPDQAIAELRTLLAA